MNRSFLLALALVPGQDLGLPAPEAVKRMTLPPGFKAHVFAAEPDLRQPNAFCIDDRGRLWVAENYSYTGPGGPWKPSGKDTILIFEDSDGDGRFDTRKVFADTLSFISGLEIGFGGVWVGSPPNLLFIPDKDADDRPDGEPQILLDGWGRQDQHETLNSFIWGPDGWLYGCHGVFTHSRVGRPGTPDAERVVVNAAIWRYHPALRSFERVAEGTSNPWGLDFDDHGQAFIEACVIPHLWYVVPGGRYHRQGGQHQNRHTYDDLKTIADHKHDGIKGRKGGHAHGGARFVLHDQWPAEWRGRFLVGTIHHHGIYTEAFERKGSGFSGKHVDDFMMAGDPLYLGFNHDFGPDGSLYVIDWYDPKSCHGQTPEHRETGRLYKITHGESRRCDVDLGRLPSAELVKLQLSDNEWYVRHARRLLQERGADPEVHRALRTLMGAAADAPKLLRLVWALHATGGLDEDDLLGLTRNAHEYVRSWAVRLLCEGSNPSEAALKRLAELASEDGSAAVRLHLASVMQRTPPDRRWPVLEALAGNAGDAGDHNLPLMIWYALEPLVAGNAARAVMLAQKSKIPKVREFVIRRMTAASGAGALRGPKEAPSASVSEDGLVLDLKAGEAPGGVPGTQPRRAEVGGRPASVYDGIDDHSVIPAAAELSFKATDPMTLSAWVHLTDVPLGRWVSVTAKSRDSAPWYGLWIEPEGRWTFGGTGKNLSGPAAFEGWQHVCGVQSAGKRRLYVNGHLEGTGDAAAGDGPGALWIGGAASTKEFLAASIGGLRIYRRALSAAEVSFLAANP
jgi:putative membrane-bound dehydrogenase-like protein